jgi:ribA/ribD-fused uncharacterized protein
MTDPKTTPTSERAAFEAWWFEPEGFCLRAERFDTPTDGAWAAWEHLRATPPAPQQPTEAQPDAEDAARYPDGTLRTLDTPSRVRFYEHDFYVLSNFSAFKLHWKGLPFDTSEAAYHWEKFSGDSGAAQLMRRFILTASSAHEAFKVAEHNKPHRRADWDDVKVGIMRDILRAKAQQHEYVRRKLLATGDRELVEDSWRDDFWGWGANRDGQNMLGKLWMEVRAEFAAIDAARGTLKDKP